MRRSLRSLPRPLARTARLRDKAASPKFRLAVRRLRLLPSNQNLVSAAFGINKMIGFFIVGISVNAIVIWLYLILSPRNTTFRTRWIFEVLVFFSVVLAALLSTIYSYMTIGQSVDSGWWPFVAFFYGFVSIPVVLIIAAIIRRFVYRKKTLPNHGLESTGAPPAADAPETHP